MNRILVIDDSISARWIFNQILTTKGYDVIEATNGTEGIEKIFRYKPDCVLLDMFMPDITGYEVLRCLREKKNHVPVIILSADIQEITKEKCRELEVTDFLNKPPDEEKLIIAVEKALASLY